MVCVCTAIIFSRFHCCTRAQDSRHLAWMPLSLFQAGWIGCATTLADSHLFSKRSSSGWVVSRRLTCALSLPQLGSCVDYD